MKKFYGYALILALLPTLVIAQEPGDGQAYADALAEEVRQADADALLKRVDAGRRYYSLPSWDRPVMSIEYDLDMALQKHAEGHANEQWADAEYDLGYYWSASYWYQMALDAYLISLGHAAAAYDAADALH